MLISKSKASTGSGRWAIARSYPILRPENIVRRLRNMLPVKAKLLRKTSLASVNGTAKTPFSFKTLGSLAAIGRRTGVARILGVNFSGFLAWFLWRGIYWSKLPRMEKKVRVAIDWALDVLFTKDFVQFLDQRALAHTQTETGAAPWNRDQLSDPPKTTIASLLRNQLKPTRHEYNY